MTSDDAIPAPGGPDEPAIALAAGLGLPVTDAAVQRALQASVYPLPDPGEDHPRFCFGLIDTWPTCWSSTTTRCPSPATSPASRSFSSGSSTGPRPDPRPGPGSHNPQQYGCRIPAPSRGQALAAPDDNPHLQHHSGHQLTFASSLPSTDGR